LLAFCCQHAIPFVNSLLSLQKVMIEELIDWYNCIKDNTSSICMFF
jgi:hypothetical protein